MKPCVRRSSIRNQRGFSLVEVMVSFGIAMGMLLGMVSVVERINSAYADMKLKMGVMSLVNEVSLYTMGFGDCDDILPSTPQTFSYSGAISTTGVEIQLMIMGKPLMAGQEIGELNIIADSVKFTMPSPTAYFYTYQPANVSTYFGRIELTPRKSEMSVGGEYLRTRPLGNVLLKVNSTGQIIGCVGMQAEEIRCVSNMGSPHTWDTATGTCVAP